MKVISVKSEKQINMGNDKSPPTKTAADYSGDGVTGTTPPWDPNKLSDHSRHPSTCPPLPVLYRRRQTAQFFPSTDTNNPILFTSLPNKFSPVNQNPSSSFHSSADFFFHSPFSLAAILLDPAVCFSPWMTMRKYNHTHPIRIHRNQTAE